MKNKSFQKEAFKKFEGDAWFNRNKKSISKYSANNDYVISLIKNYKIHPASVLEIGCSAGYRLSGIKTLFPNAEVTGVDPSKEAIDYGRKQYQNVNLIEGTIDDLRIFENEKFDVVIIGFVFYVVDRNLLLKSISEVDRVLRNNGFIVLIDFYSERAIIRNYHHITDFAAYTFKQKYDEIFTSTQLYHLIDRTCYNHETNQQDITTNFQNLYSISLLKKDLIASYK